MLIAVALAAALGLVPAVAGCGSGSAEAPAGEASPVRVAFFASGLANTYVPAQVQGAKSGRGRGCVDHGLRCGLRRIEAADAGPGRDHLGEGSTRSSSRDGRELARPADQEGDLGRDKVACISAPCGPDLTSLKPRSKLTVHVGHSFVTSGRLLGEQVVAACADRRPLQGRLLPGLYSYPADKIRTDAFHAALEGHPAIEIVSEQEGKYSRRPRGRDAEHPAGAQGRERSRDDGRPDGVRDRAGGQRRRRPRRR